MATFSCRGDDGVNREVELELQTCDICLKVVLGMVQAHLPPPFTEKQWPEVQAQLQKLGLLPENVTSAHLHELWDR